MEQTTPEWLNETFLSTCLQGNDPGAPPVTIISFDVKAGVAPGNNYGSVILRVKVEYKERNSNKEKSESLIVKGPASNTLVDMITELFGMAECNFYYLYLPILSNIIKEHITAKAYFTPMQSVIVLEDLKESGFAMADRQKQLDYNHCKLYFTASAKFHAAGVLIGKQNPDLLKKLPGVFDKMISSGDATQMNLFIHDMLIGLKCLIKSIEPLGLDEYKPYIETIKKFIKLNTEYGDTTKTMNLQTMAETNNKMFKSFIHGDCWTTNMMFKHNDSGNPVDIRLIDFQGFRYDTVISDMINFTWMSCNNEVLEYHLDELYNTYCDTLNAKLAEFGCPERLSFERLKEEICQNGSQILSMIGLFLPLTQHDELIDTTQMFTGKVKEDDIMKFYQGEHFFRKFPYILKFVAAQGIFDHMEKDFIQWEQYGEQLNSS